MNCREDYIDNLHLGDLVAFKLYEKEAKMYSGKISKLGKTKAEIETKNGKKYFVEKKNIRWVNITGKWPAHVMQALKGIDVEEEEVEIVEIIDECLDDVVEEEVEEVDWDVDGVDGEGQD